MNGSILSLWLILSCVTLAEAPADDSADLSEAKRLFDEGTARYEAADFNGAIEVFTLALSELREQGVDDFRIRGLLLFNIGRAHMRAYEIDEEIEHLRQARSIFQRFVTDAHSYPDQVEARDVAEAEAELDEIETLLDEHVSSPEPTHEPEPRPDSPETDKPQPELRRLRASGIGLTVAGVALLGGGVGMLAWGSGYGAAAENQVAGLDALMLPMDSVAYDDGDAFIASERRKGAAWMGVGAVVTAGGVISLALGIRQLVRAKRVKQVPVTASAAFGRDGVWVGAVGRF